MGVFILSAQNFLFFDKLNEKGKEKEKKWRGGGGKKILYKEEEEVRINESKLFTFLTDHCLQP